MKFLSWLKKRLGKVSLRSALIFTLINIAMMLFFSNLLVRIVLFIICAAVIFYLGKLPVDLDFIPLASGLLMIWYEPMMAIQFLLWTMPVTDVIAGQFNQWTFVSVVSLIIGILSSMFFRNLGYKIALAALIIVYDIIRAFITSIIMKQGISGIQASFSHSFIYLIVISALPN